MATTVKHQETGRIYVLLGSGFGAYQSKKPNPIFGDWVAETSEGFYEMLCVCDSEGRIGWIDSSEVIVDSVDEQPVRSFFAKQI